jgi:hypothetical protein
MSAPLEPGARVRHAYRDGQPGGHGRAGTVARVEASMFLVAFDDGQRVWFERADLGSTGAFSLSLSAAPAPARDAEAALARLRAHLQAAGTETPLPADPLALVDRAIRLHAHRRHPADAL